MDDDIIRMAREAQQEQLSVDGRSPSTTLNGYWFSMEVADLARFAALVRADERKRIKAEPVEPVEPVAWRITDGEGDWDYRTELPEDWSIQWSARYGRKYEPLYTAPPKRKPLPKHDQHCVDVPGYGLMAVRLVRAVERAHNITDHQIEDRLARHGIPMPGDPK